MPQSYRSFNAGFHKRRIFAPMVLSLVCCGIALSADPGGRAAGHSVRVAAGWNLLSLPVDVAAGIRDSIFPTAISGAYIFSAGYEPVDTLKKGVGFWMKFATAETVEVIGNVIDSNSIEVKAGWNLIGVLTNPVAVTMIATQPPGIIASGFFGFMLPSGYLSTDTLRPGVGYWVKFTGDGLLVLTTGGGGGGCPPSVDYEGRTYSTVQIGEQCWLGENLNVGTMIFRSSNSADNGAVEKYCYDNDTSKCASYGGLYQWNEAMQYVTAEGTRGICPPGWHIPSHTDMLALKTAVGNDGNSLKALGQGYDEGAGTNTTGFSAMLSGYRSSDDTFFYGIDESGRYWTSTLYPSDATRVIYLTLYGYAGTVGISSTTKFYGFPVRCIVD